MITIQLRSGKEIAFTPDEWFELLSMLGLPAAVQPPPLFVVKIPEGSSAPLPAYPQITC